MTYNIRPDKNELIIMFGIINAANKIMIPNIRELNVISISFFLFLFFFYIFLTLIQMSRFAVWSNLKGLKSLVSNYPFEAGYSFRFDLCLIILKILICVNKNVSFLFQENGGLILYFSRRLMIIFFFAHIFISFLS